MNFVVFLATTVVKINLVLSNPQFGGFSGFGGYGGNNYGFGGYGGDNFGSTNIYNTHGYQDNQRNWNQDSFEGYPSGSFEPQPRSSPQTQQLSALSSCNAYSSIQTENNAKFGSISIPSPDYRKSVLRVILSVAASLPSVNKLSWLKFKRTNLKKKVAF